MKNKLLLVALLVNATVAQAEYTIVRENNFAPDNAYSYENVGRLAASKDANIRMVDAYVRQVDNEIFISRVATGIIAAIFTNFICTTTASWWQNYKALCAKKNAEVQEIKTKSNKVISTLG